MTGGLYVPLCTSLDFDDQPTNRSSRGDSQSFRGRRVDRASCGRAASGRTVCLFLSPHRFASLSRRSVPSFVGHPIASSVQPTLRTMAGTVITTIAILLAVIQAALCNDNSSCCHVSPDPTKFFPNVEGNLTKIVWAHAVNSLAELEKALLSEDIMMLEADVVVGKLNTTSNQTGIPIMAHPPANESDLSLENFLDLSIHSNSTYKGIKLDFKSNEAFEISKPILTKFRTNLTFPVFLNADIFRGPVNATTTPLNAKEFLKGANETIPESILSVGWTTRYGKDFNINEGRYSSEQLQTMINALKENEVTQSVTYPVRAGLAANDIDGIKTLLKNTTFTNATLTIWSSEGDSVDAAKLSKLIKDVGLDKVYVDVPEDLKNKLELSAASTMSSTMINLGASTMALLVLLRML